MTRVCLICFLAAISLLHLGSGISGAQETEIPIAAVDINEQYRAAEKKILEPLLRLDESYGKHLEGLLKKKQGSGDLHGALEVKGKIESHKAGRANSDANQVKDSELLSSEKTYFKARYRALKKTAPERIRLLKIYDSQLSKLASTLTKAGKLDQALGIQAYAAGLEEKFLELNKLLSFGEPMKYGQPNWDFIEEAVKREKLEKVTHGEAVEGSFYDIGDKPRILVGFRLALNNFGGYKIVHGLQAVFRGSDGKDITSKTSLGTKAPADHKKVIAKPGYAVGAIEFEVAPFVRRARIHFYRVVGKKLDSKDAYATEWYGEWGNGSKQERVEAGNQIPVGIHGRDGAGLNKVGLVLISSDAGQ